MNAADFTSTVAMLGVTALGMLGALALAAGPLRERLRRARIRAEPFPAAWRRILRQRVPAVAQLPANSQRLLKQHIQVFLAEKAFVGCQVQAITDEVRFTVAAQACLLLLGDTEPACYPRLTRILVYPDAFQVQHERALGDGTVQVQAKALAGESWVQGQVILAWAEVVAGAANRADGRNVVLHEFAHQIDQDTGHADGRPWRPTAAARRRWNAVMGAAFEQLQQQPSAVIDDYGASDPAEFFAVLTEVFFERPEALAAEAPEVFRELVGLYRVDPTTW